LNGRKKTLDEMNQGNGRVRRTVQEGLSGERGNNVLHNFHRRVGGGGRLKGKGRMCLQGLPSPLKEKSGTKSFEGGGDLQKERMVVKLLSGKVQGSNCVDGCPVVFGGSFLW